jgi:hypothetical protein
MADPVEAGFDIPLQDPSWSVPIAEQEMNLLDGIGTAAFQPKAIGMAIGQSFRDGIESEQVERLHGPVSHRGNAERTLLTVAFGNVHAPQGLRPVAVPAQ